MWIVELADSACFQALRFDCLGIRDDGFNCTDARFQYQMGIRNQSNLPNNEWTITGLNGKSHYWTRKGFRKAVAEHVEGVDRRIGG